MDAAAVKSDNPQGLLRSFLATEDRRQADSTLERLVHEHADPVIKSVVVRKMEVYLDSVWRADRRRFEGEGRAAPKRSRELDAEDVHATAVLSLVERLSVLKADRDSEPIQDFRTYVARIALNAFAMHMRRLHPERHRLRRKLWYLIHGDTPISGFALWRDRDSGEELYGFKAWEGQPLRLSANYRKWQNDPEDFERSNPAVDLRRSGLHEIIAAALTWVAAPMGVEDLLSGLMEILNLREPERIDG